MVNQGVVKCMHSKGCFTDDKGYFTESKGPERAHFCPNKQGCGTA